MTKIIHILHHSPSPIAYESGPEDKPPESSNPTDSDYAIKIDEEPYWVCFAQNDFHAKLAYSALKITNDFEIECWRPYKLIKKPYSKEIKGVLHRVFPSNNIAYGSYNFGEESPLLIKKLKEEITKGGVIVHLHGLHDHTANRFLQKIYKYDVPIVGTQRGGAYPSYFLRKKKWFINIYLLMEIIRERLIFPSIDLFIFQSKIGYEYISSTYGKDKIIHLQDGLDFKQFKSHDKKKVREELGIPQSSKVLLYVGGLITHKGVDNIFWTFQKLKELDSSYELYCIGSNVNDELYKIMSNTKDCNLISRTTADILSKYYSAADIALYPTDYAKYRDFAGISNANIESLASNTPILTSQLIHFMGTDNEKNRIGKQYKNKAELPSQVRQMIANKANYSDCREIAFSYYDRHKNVSRMLDYYRILERKYNLKDNF